MRFHFQQFRCDALRMCSMWEGDSLSYRSTSLRKKNHCKASNHNNLSKEMVSTLWPEHSTLFVHKSQANHPLIKIRRNSRQTASQFSFGDTVKCWRRFAVSCPPSTVWGLQIHAVLALHQNLLCFAAISYQLLGWTEHSKPTSASIPNFPCKVAIIFCPNEAFFLVFVKQQRVLYKNYKLFIIITLSFSAPGSSPCAIL